LIPETFGNAPESARLQCKDRPSAEFEAGLKMDALGKSAIMMLLSKFTGEGY
jgi:hypothetical protein